MVLDMTMIINTFKGFLIMIKHCLGSSNVGLGINHSASEYLTHDHPKIDSSTIVKDISTLINSVRLH